jgi:hypothetical protein
MLTGRAPASTGKCVKALSGSGNAGEEAMADFKVRWSRALVV